MYVLIPVQILLHGDTMVLYQCHCAESMSMQMVVGFYDFLSMVYQEGGELPWVEDHVPALLPLFNFKSLKVLFSLVMVKDRYC